MGPEASGFDVGRHKCTTYILHVWSLIVAPLRDFRTICIMDPCLHKLRPCQIPRPKAPVITSVFVSVSTLTFVLRSTKSISACYYNSSLVQYAQYEKVLPIRTFLWKVIVLPRWFNLCVTSCLFARQPLRLPCSCFQLLFLLSSGNHIHAYSSATTWQISTKLGHNDHWPCPQVSYDFDLRLTFDLDIGVKNVI